MARGPHYTDADDRALQRLYRIHRSDWSHHVADFPELAARSIPSMRSRIYQFLKLPSLMAREALPAPIEDWSAMAGRRFDDDLRAVTDHGSLANLGYPPITHSPSGCSARWASEGA